MITRQYNGQTGVPNKVVFSICGTFYSRHALNMTGRFQATTIFLVWVSQYKSFLSKTPGCLVWHISNVHLGLIHALQYKSAPPSPLMFKMSQHTWLFSQLVKHQAHRYTWHYRQKKHGKVFYLIPKMLDNKPHSLPHNLPLVQRPLPTPTCYNCSS